MSALADVLAGWKWRLTGSDLRSDCAQELTAAGVVFFHGHRAEHVPPDADLVVASDAVPRDNPEILRAAQLGLPVLSYFEMLGQLTRNTHCLAVAGTHGKSTVTAMAAHVLVQAGRDPTVVCGAAPLGRPSGGRAGSDETVLVEACEYRANFLNLHPQHAVILGIEPDHFDYYKTPEQLRDAFAEFARRTPPTGLVLARADCAVGREIVRDLPCRVETFAVEGAADWSAGQLADRRGWYSFALLRQGRRFCDVELRVPGRHNVSNAVAAAALAAAEGVSPDAVAEGLSDFAGLRRRLEHRGTHRGVVVLDDYAHHPTEIAATLAAVRLMCPGRRLWCVFQPHQAGRTERLLDELAESLHNADKVLVGDIFRAREAPAVAGEVCAADLARLVRQNVADVPDVHSPDEIVRLLEDRLEPGDVLLTMGAGDIGKVADHLVRSLDGGRAAA